MLAFPSSSLKVIQQAHSSSSNVERSIQESKLLSKKIDEKRPRGTADPVTSKTQDQQPAPASRTWKWSITAELLPGPKSAVQYSPPRPSSASLLTYSNICLLRNTFHEASLSSCLLLGFAAMLKTSSKVRADL